MIERKKWASSVLRRRRWHQRQAPQQEDDDNVIDETIVFVGNRRDPENERSLFSQLQDQLDRTCSSFADDVHVDNIRNPLHFPFQQNERNNRSQHSNRRNRHHHHLKNNHKKCEYIDQLEYDDDRSEHSDDVERRTDLHRRQIRENSPSSGGNGRNSGNSILEDNAMLPIALDRDLQKKLIYRQFGEIASEVLEVMGVDGVPEPSSANHVIVKVQASTVSYNDCILRRGICFKILNPISLPVTPGFDVVGTIAKRGLNVKGFKVGERVAALVQTGGNSRYISVPASSLVHVPTTVDAAEAASVVSTYMTAYQAILLVTKDKVSLENKRVLITEGLEPVGQALIQLCHKVGAKEVYTTAPDHRHPYVTAVLGACPLPTDPYDWLPLVRHEMDIVFDGTCDDGFESSHAALCKGGILVCHGMSALLDDNEGPGVFGAPLTAFWTKFRSQVFMSQTFQYCVWESFQHDPERYKLDLEVLFQLLQKQYIRPHISKRVTLLEVAEAQEDIEQGNRRGEIVCLPWKKPVKASVNNTSKELFSICQWKRGYFNSPENKHAVNLRNTIRKNLGGAESKSGSGKSGSGKSGGGGRGDGRAAAGSNRVKKKSQKRVDYNMRLENNSQGMDNNNCRGEKNSGRRGGYSSRGDFSSRGDCSSRLSAGYSSRAVSNSGTMEDTLTELSAIQNSVVEASTLSQSMNSTISSMAVSSQSSSVYSSSSNSESSNHETINERTATVRYY